MSICGVSSCTNSYRSQFQQLSKDFSALKSSLASGDITTAQESYATLTQDLQSVRQARGIESDTDSAINTDLEALGKALESGDLEGAQSAFATLTKDLQSSSQTQGNQRAYGHSRHRHHHEDGANSQGVGTSLGANLASLAKALQSGDLEGAQSAFAKLAQDLGTSSARNATSTDGSSGFSFSLSISYTSISISA
jgi:hypothetical protein